MGLLQPLPLFWLCLRVDLQRGFDKNLKRSLHTKEMLGPAQREIEKSQVSALGLRHTAGANEAVLHRLSGHGDRLFPQPLRLPCPPQRPAAMTPRSGMIYIVPFSVRCCPGETQSHQSSPGLLCLPPPPQVMHAPGTAPVPTRGTGPGTHHGAVFRLRLPGLPRLTQRQRLQLQVGIAGLRLLGTCGGPGGRVWLAFRGAPGSSSPHSPRSPISADGSPSRYALGAPAQRSYPAPPSP